MVSHLHIGGLMAAGFDPTGRYLLAISHSGRGVFETERWVRVARDLELAYPENGMAAGIGPLDGQVIPIVEKNYETEEFEVISTNGRFRLHCESDGIDVWATNG